MCEFVQEVSQMRSQYPSWNHVANSCAFGRFLPQAQCHQPAFSRSKCGQYCSTQLGHTWLLTPCSKKLSRYIFCNRFAKHPPAWQKGKWYNFRGVIFATVVNNDYVVVKIEWWFGLKMIVLKWSFSVLRNRTYSTTKFLDQCPTNGWSLFEKCKKNTFSLFSY